MKALKHIVTAILALSLFTSCGILGGTSSNTGATTTSTSSGNSVGINTGSALASIFSILQSTGIIDLGNITNLINLGQILLGANSLTNATQAYTDQFAADLIKGSNNKVNNSNVASVIAGLKNLAATDTSILQKSTQAAYTGSLVPVATSNKNVKANMDAINAIMGAMK